MTSARRLAVCSHSRGTGRLQIGIQRSPCLPDRWRVLCSVFERIHVAKSLREFTIECIGIAHTLASVSRRVHSGRACSARRIRHPQSASRLYHVVYVSRSVDRANQMLQRVAFFHSRAFPRKSTSAPASTFLISSNPCTRSAPTVGIT